METIPAGVEVRWKRDMPSGNKRWCWMFRGETFVTSWGTPARTSSEDGYTSTFRADAEGEVVSFRNVGGSMAGLPGERFVDAIREAVEALTEGERDAA